MKHSRIQQTEKKQWDITASAATIIIAIILFGQGCTTPKLIITEQQRAGLGHIGIVGTDLSPRVDMSSLPISKGRGASRGALKGLADSGGCGIAAPFCMIFLPLIGAIAGAATIESPDDVQISQESFSGNQIINEAQSLLKQKVLTYAETYSDRRISLAPSAEIKPADEGTTNFQTLGLKGYDTILEVKVNQIKSWSPEKENKVYFFITSTARLISTLDGSEILNKRFKTRIGWHRPADWIMNNGKNMNRALDRGLEQIAETIVDNLLLGELIPATHYPRTLAPEVVQPNSKRCELFGSGCTEFEDQAVLDDLKPAFQWKNFPGEFVINRSVFVTNKENINEIDRDTIALITQGIGGVRYDFRLNAWPDGTVYQRLGLSETEHTLDHALDSCRSYSWTVRARYANKGKKRVSGWSKPQLFRTPCGITQPLLLASESGFTLKNQQPEGMVQIEGGSFLMGDPASVSDHEILRQHRVWVSPFLFDTHEVTQGQFLKVMNYNPSDFLHPNRPVEQVRWDTAVRYCQKLGKRLPTEAEWEYAARAGTETKYSFGNKSVEGFGNYCYQCWGIDNTFNASNRPDDASSRPNATSVVKKFKPNQWELYDLYGNVAEWVTDWHGPYTAFPSIDPIGPTAGEEKIIRGGSFADTGYDVVSYRRAKAEPIDKSNKIGFRCAANVS